MLTTLKCVVRGPSNEQYRWDVWFSTTLPWRLTRFHLLIT